jgi:glycosyltransferase involved in cell wall biosynthesis
LTEGFGFPVLEAMSCGCPVIASDAAAIAEVAGDAAVLCNPNDEASWTAEIETLQRDKVRLAGLAVAGRHRASRFTWRRAAQQLLAILDDEPALSRDKILLQPGV